MLHVIPDAVFLHVEELADDARLFREALNSVTGNVRVRRVSSTSAALELLSGAPVAKSAGHGASGYGAPGHVPYDCVIASMSLPGGGAVELARRLRQRYDTATLPVIGLGRDAPQGENTSWLDAVYQKSDSRQGLRPVAQAIVRLWFDRARRYHC